jgi:hypothetical protein
MNFLQRRKILKNTNSLDLTPIKKIEFKVDDDNNITLKLPRFRNEKFRKLFIPQSRSEFIQIKLDEIGSATWMLIDGKKNVQQICKELDAQFGDKVSPVVERINKFLTGLYNNRYISFKQLED